MPSDLSLSVFQLDVPNRFPRPGFRRRQSRHRTLFSDSGGSFVITERPTPAASAA
ncbi:MAG: hypothetical protein R2735_08825 [Microthrixaceae bacterium]